MARKASILVIGLLTLLWWGYANGSGLGVGAHYSNVHNQTTDDNSGMLGAQLRLRGSIIGVEGAIDYRNDKLGGGTELRSWPISASLLIYPLPPVYAMAGLGWYNTTIDFSSSSPYKNETQSKLGYHFGAGLELPVAPALKLVGDIRWQFVDYEFKNIPSSIGKVNADSYSINAGFLFYLR